MHGHGRETVQDYRENQGLGSHLPRGQQGTLYTLFFPFQLPHYFLTNPLFPFFPPALRKHVFFVQVQIN